MAYHPATHLGSAERRRFVEIPLSDLPDILSYEEPTNATTKEDGDRRRYAQLVYVVNPAPVNLSGDVVIDTGNLEDINSDILNAILSGIIDPALAVVVEESGDFTWVAEALAGTDRSSALWRVKQIEAIETGNLITTEIKWADGNGNFDNTATHPLSSLSFT
jgi:hypothetical protein